MTPRPVSPIDASVDPVQNAREQRAGIERLAARVNPLARRTIVDKRRATARLTIPQVQPE